MSNSEVRGLTKQTELFQFGDCEKFDLQPATCDGRNGNHYPADDCYEARQIFQDALSESDTTPPMVLVSTY